MSLWICLALALGTLAVYWPALHFDYVNYDDGDYVMANAHVQSGVNRASVVWAFETVHASNWHPLTWLSHELDCQMYGPKAGGPHLTNVLLHVANTLLLFGVMRAMTGAVWRSALVAGLFAWHPTHVESVAWISERKDVLSTFFWLLTMLAYAAYAKEFKVQGPGFKVLRRNHHECGEKSDYAHPHPGPLPRGEGETYAIYGEFGSRCFRLPPWSRGVFYRAHPTSNAEI